VILNVILNSIFIFIFDMKSLSIAIATSISSIFNFLLLNYYLKKSDKTIFQKSNFLSYFKISFCSICAFFTTAFIGYLLNDQSIFYLFAKDYILPISFISKLNSFLILSSLFFISLFSFAYIFKASEILDIIPKRLRSKINDESI
jgi:peptidoglycan biosynthesis protein MviN/MurJ (putative lipid II flippase)